MVWSLRNTATESPVDRNSWVLAAGAGKAGVSNDTSALFFLRIPILALLCITSQRSAPYFIELFDIFFPAGTNGENL